MTNRFEPSENVAETRLCPGESKASLKIQGDAAGIF